ncbi:MAG: AMP-binding protein, partial [Jatrophihabitantaceae bacterium]
MAKGSQIMWDTLVRPSADRSAAFRAAGLWREETILDDLARAVLTHPDKAAIISYRGGKLVRTVNYGELGMLVDRFAAALLELGVQRQDVVVIHLPNWWMLSPLYLACSRIGAIPAPAVPALGARELGYVLANSAAKVCIVADDYLGIDYQQRLNAAAPDSLAHRVVVRGGDSAVLPGAIDFDDFFLNTPWEQRHQLADVQPPAADDVALLLFTSGTTGAPKAVVHSYNTLYAAAIALPNSGNFGPDTVVTVPHYQTHMAGLIFAAYLALVLGGTSVMQDDSDMALLLDMIARHGVTFGYSAPVYVMGMVAEQRKQPRDLSSLRHLISGSAPIPPQLISDVAESLGVELGALWGMTENGPVTVTRSDDPVGWAANSDGALVPGSELRIDAEPGDEIGRLLVRG